MPRSTLLQQWLQGLFPGRAFSLAPASADASFRQYFRIQLADSDESFVVMDAPPQQENCQPFIQVAALFAQAGVTVPKVLAQDLEQGFLLLTDFGSTTYLQVLNLDTARYLYGEACQALVNIQASSRPGVLPEYDRALLQRELDLFPEWYLGRHLQVQLSDTQKNDLQAVFDRVLSVNLAEPKVFVHRDFHSRNLMFLAQDGTPGILDFQDAVYGPLSYDLVSLFKDAYIEWEEEDALDWLVRYWEVARKAGLPVHSDFALFHRDYEFMGVQRHLKVLGIFARLYHRDGKEAYLKDMPLVSRYLRKACERYGVLKPLLRLLDEVEGRAEEVGYTF